MGAGASASDKAAEVSAAVSAAPQEELDAVVKGLAAGDREKLLAALKTADKPAGKFSFVYWPLKAKNIASIVALEVSGLDWEVGPRPGGKGTGDLWAEWL